MVRRACVFIAIVAAILAIGGCRISNAPDENAGGDVRGPDRKLAEMPVPANLAAANTRFAFKLWDRLAKSEAGKSVFISPVSISLALGMTYNGADGTTAEAMARTLEYDGMTLEELNAGNAILLSHLAYGDEKVVLETANSLWPKPGFPFYDSFIENVRNAYLADVMPLPATPEPVNAWISERTHGKIPKTLESIEDQIVLLLVNAIYFNGTWTTEFDPKDTAPRPFTLLDGTTKNVPTMRQEDRYSYLETDDFQAVSIPYGDSSRFSMYVFLPAPNSSLAAFQANLTAENWDAWMGQFREKSGTIYLPKFTLEYSRKLNDDLTALGMGVAFEKWGANFRKMAPVDMRNDNLYIDFVIHKSFVQVDEEGTEAAAVTVVGIGYVTSVNPNGPFTMRVDRPFFFAIRDNHSGAILFMGSIVEPKTR